jgi:hypothetical protein
VRARALSDLSEVVACFGELLARDPASDEYRVAERFVAGLVAAAHLEVGAHHLRPPRTRARAHARLHCVCEGTRRSES